MLAESSNNPVQDLRALKAAVGQAGIAWRARLLMLVLNFIPLFHITLVVIPLFLPYSGLTRIGIALGLLYLVPPLTARLALMGGRKCVGRIPIGSKAFFIWWFVFQLQIVFCRLPTLEEILRLIPGLYSQWMRLWGSRIGRFTYWSPGTLITDRSFLSIGDDVVLGAGVRLNAHVLAKAANGELELLLAPVCIGDRVLVGGYSLLTAGTEIAENETTRAFLISPPFSKWKHGKRVRGEGEGDSE